MELIRHFLSKGGVLLIALPFMLGCAVLSGVNPLVVSTSTPLSFTATVTPEATVTSTPTENPIVCGGPSVMYILLIGSDARSNSYEVGLADSIHVIRVDFINPSVHGLAFPRDLYVEIPGIEGHNGITHGKLNQAFLYGNPGYGYYDGPDLGPGLLADTLKLNFGVTSDHYVAVNLQTFVKVIDALGGIDVTLPFEVDGRAKDSKNNDRYFPAGYQHLSGYRAMLLARMRPYGDIRRSEVQNIILKALAEKLLSPSVIPQLGAIAESFNDSAMADFDSLDVGKLACLASMLDPEDLEFTSFPDKLFKSTRVQDPVLGNTSIIAADFEVLRAYVQKFKDGIPFEE